MKEQCRYRAKEFTALLEKNRGILTPLADAFGDRKTLMKDYKSENMNDAQANHVISWFNNKGDRSACKIFNSLNDPAMIIWLSEILRLDNAIIEKAIKKAGDTYMNPNFDNTKKGSALLTSQMKQVKSELNWDVIYEAICNINS